MVKVKKTVLSYIFMHASFLLYSFVGTVSKTAANQGLFTPFFFIYAVSVLAILAVYALMWQQVLRRFSLAKAYPNKGAVVIWNLLWAAIFFNEVITINNMIGSAVIIVGIVLVSTDEN
jgi:drug/metabolite transporter (DMT)-like permease